jgi:hypothetical protein
MKPQNALTLVGAGARRVLHENDGRNAVLFDRAPVQLARLFASYCARSVHEDIFNRRGAKTQKAEPRIYF